MGQAKRRQAEIEQLKARGPKPKAQTPHSTDKKSGIISYYWGYRADEGDQGFEFSTMTLTGMGMDYATATNICALVKKSSDYQLRILESGETQQRFNLSREEFIEEEHHRMLGTVAWLNQFVRQHQGKINLKDRTVMSQIMIFCCAVSTMVAVGRLQQDEWNGDNFGYASMDSELWNSMMATA